MNSCVSVHFSLVFFKVLAILGWKISPVFTSGISTLHGKFSFTFAIARINRKETEGIDD